MDDLLMAIAGSQPIVLIETGDEKYVCEQLLDIAKGLRKPAYCWTVSDGLKQLSKGLTVRSPAVHTDAEAVLRHIKDQHEAGIYVLCDFHPFLADDPLNTRLVKDIGLNHDVIAHVVVLVSHTLALPDELSGLGQKVSLSFPSDAEITVIVREEAARWAAQHGGRVSTDRAALNALVRSVKGLGSQDVRRLVRHAIWDDGVIDHRDVPAVNKAKFELMNMDGILSFEFEVQAMDQIGGLDGFKGWLAQRTKAFLAADDQADRPKGVLLVGVQGAGKSLAAKAVAGLWQVPLLRLDFGALYNKFFGETERNLRASLSQAELMAPCVLWLDEIEKGLATGDSDNGTSRRVLATLLTWMAERTQPVFMVATSNDISQLPPELLRKGRFDEIFFVDLPDAAARASILTIHLNRRDISTIDFDMDMLSEASDGFSGAEIEQAVVSAIYAASASGETLTDAGVLAQIVNTRPLSVVMAEQMAGLRAWADERTVRA